MGLKNFFHFNLRQYRGIFILSTIIIILSLILFLKNSKQKAEIKISIKTLSEKTLSDTLVLKKFDPNKCDSTDFIKLGFSAKQSSTILKYKKSIGGFFKDTLMLKKCYAISADKWEEIKNFVDIKQVHSKKREKKLFVIDINKSGIEELKSHTMLDDDLAEKLYHSRIKYGGFVSLEQMLEIFKTDKDKISSLEKQLFFDTLKIIKYDINSDNEKLLASHPYISKNFAKSIVDYIKTNDKIKSEEQLRQLKYFPKSKQKWLFYYINFDD